MVRDTCLDRGHDAGLAVAVRGHDPVGQAGHLDDRPQLADGELLVDRDRRPPTCTPPEAQTLMTLALRRSCSRTARMHSAAPSASRSVADRWCPKSVDPGQRIGVQVGVAAGGAEDRTAA